MDNELHSHPFEFKDGRTHPERSLATMLLFQPMLKWFVPSQPELWTKEAIQELVDKGYLDNEYWFTAGDTSRPRWSITDKARKELIDHGKGIERTECPHRSRSFPCSGR